MLLFDSFPNVKGESESLSDPPPNGQGPMILYAQNAIFLIFFHRSLQSRLILSIILI